MYIASKLIPRKHQIQMPEGGDGKEWRGEVDILCSVAGWIYYKTKTNQLSQTFHMLNNLRF